MELLYIWIEDYKNIRRQGFNFSAQYRFEFTDLQISKDEKGETVTGGELKVTKNPNYIKNFFDENITNVTAIVGENGSGKTSLAEFLFMALGNLPSSLFKHKCICIIKRENNLWVYYEKSLAVNCAFKTHLIYYEIDLNKSSEMSGGGNDPEDLANFILFSNVLDNGYKYDSRRSGINISTNAFLREKSINEFILNDLSYQIEFILSSNVKLSFKIPKTILMVIEWFLDEKNFALYSYFNERIKQIEANTKFLYKFYEAIFFYILDYLKNTKEGFDFKPDLSEEPTIEMLLDELFIKLCDEKQKDKSNKFDKKFLLSVVKELIDIVSKGELKNKYDRELGKGSSVELPIQDIKELLQIRYKFDEFNLTYSKKLSEHLFKPFSFEWQDYSTGELFLLVLFARFHYAKTKISKENIIILIDEGELGMHPQWQKQYLHNILTVLPQIFKGKKLQFILTSHSPFLVSDLPKDHIIFLEKGEDGACKVKDSLNEMKQTFGANIHTLLTDSFFMKGGLMGEFAKEKLKNVLMDITDNIDKIGEDRKKEIGQIISMVGEPLLRKKLERLYSEKINPDNFKTVEDLTEEEKRLEERLDKIKEEKKKRAEK